MNRALLRYHGGKWLLAPWIISHMPAHRVYTETFGGAGGVLLRKPRAYVEIYNDLSGEVVNVFRVARDQGQQLKEALRLTPFSRAEFDLSYEPAADPIERARRTVVRSFMGFGSTAILGKSSGFRPNSKGDAIPARTWKTYAEDFESYIERLRGVIIEQKPALEVMAAHDSPETLHYVDPPYLFSTRGPQTLGKETPKHQYAFEMSDDEHRELARRLNSLEGFVMVSGYRNEIYDEAFKNWRIVEKETYADGARKRTECLWLSPNIQRRGQGNLI